jgi:hypothetical protein
MHAFPETDTLAVPGLMCDTHSANPQPEGPSGPSYLLANLRQPGPLGWKLRRLAANMGIKISRRQGCCGHPGEPGC